MRDRFFETLMAPPASLRGLPYRLCAAWTERRMRLRAEAELRGFGTRELSDLALGYGEIDHAVRHGRDRP